MTYRRTLITVDYCVTPTEYIKNAGILIEGEQIIGIGGESGFLMDPDIRVCKYPGTYAMPGFIDTHIHGCNGFDATSAPELMNAFPVMCRALASHGVTSFIPTLVSAPIPRMIAALDILATEVETPRPYAEPVGIHLEGPFISLSRRSSQRIEDLSAVDLGLARELIAAARGKIKIWTFAPELENAPKLVELLCEHHIIPSMGHTDAEEPEIMRAIDAGASRCTHIFNGVPPLDKRRVTLAAIALTDDRITTEIILDGTHVHPRIIELTFRCKPKGKLVAISDTVQGVGLSNGTYHLGLSEIKLENGISVTPEGILAGSTQTLEKGWNRLIKNTGISQTDAANCFTSNPATSVGLDDRGVLSPGLRADIALFDTETNACVLSIIRGNIAYAANTALYW